jgi:hypothetical protein
MKCKRCGSDKTYRSHSGNSRLGWLGRALFVSVRCYSCEHRFLATRLATLLNAVPPAPHASSIKRRAA